MTFTTRSRSSSVIWVGVAEIFKKLTEKFSQLFWCHWSRATA